MYVLKETRGGIVIVYKTALEPTRFIERMKLTGDIEILDTVSSYEELEATYQSRLKEYGLSEEPLSVTVELKVPDPIEQPVVIQTQDTIDIKEPIPSVPPIHSVLETLQPVETFDQKKKVYSIERKQAISRALKGRKLSEETKKKMSEAHKKKV
jgi:hypothetical protein